MVSNCQRCGHPLEILQNPVERLRGTGYRWRGFVSLFTRALRNCPNCGTVYTGDGELLATSVVETAYEVTVRAFRQDMMHLRDAFAAVTIGAELGVAWMLRGPGQYGVWATILTGVIGLLAVPPFVFFARRVRQAGNDLKTLRAARMGEPLPPSSATSTTTTRI